MALRTYISVFSGAGGLDLAVRIAMPDARCVCHVEIEAAAAAILASRMEEGSVDEAPIWSDARTFDGIPWRGRVGGIIAGFPCPDYSLAGRRAGIGGKHGQLWYHLARIIREVEPDWVFLENVPGILNPHRIKRWRCVGRDLFGRTIWSQYHVPAGIGFVLGDLAEMGFDAEWGCVSASQVGAAHKRERWWCVAYRASRGFGELREPSGRDGFSDWHGEAVDYSPGARLTRGRSASGETTGDETRLFESSGRRDPLADAECSKRWPYPDGAGCAQSWYDGEGQAPSGTGRGVGELREPSGRDRLTDGRGEAVADSGDGFVSESGWKTEERGRVGQASEVVGDADERDDYGSRDARARGRRESTDYGGDMGDTIGEALEIGRGERSDDGAECAPTERAGDDVGDSHESRADDESEGCCERHTTGESGIPLFAPGPDSREWAELLVRYPWLRPSIAQAEAQSAFRGVADGLAGVVANTRADALRAAGNGAVAVAGAVALRELLRRIG